jgi:hypothetical protein
VWLSCIFSLACNTPWSREKATTASRDPDMAATVLLAVRKIYWETWIVLRCIGLWNSVNGISRVIRCCFVLRRSRWLDLGQEWQMSLRLVKGKAVPLQAWGAPEGSRKSRFPDFLTTAHDGGKVAGLTHRPRLPPGNTPGTHFCWRLSRPQGHSAIRRIYVNKNFQWYHLGSNQRPSDL